MKIDFLSFLLLGMNRNKLQIDLMQGRRAYLIFFLKKNRWVFVYMPMVNLAWANTESGSPFQRGFGCNWHDWVLDITNPMLGAETKVSALANLLNKVENYPIFHRTFLKPPIWVHNHSKASWVQDQGSWPQEQISWCHLEQPWGQAAESALYCASGLAESRT